MSQECTDPEFREFFQQFGRVLDATLMMDKDTGRPRGFGFVTFDSEAAVDRTLEMPLSIHNKFIEVKRAQPRKDIADGDTGGRGGFGRGRGRGDGGGGGGGYGNPNEQPQGGQNNNPNNLSPAMMAQYWQRMQQYFQMMQQGMMNNQGGGMNPQMMQQMASMQGYPGMPSNGSPMNGGQGQEQGNFNAQEQLMFEQQKYERQTQARMSQGSYQGGNTWEGMYEDAAPPAGMAGNARGGFGGRGGRGGRGSQGSTPQPAAQAPAGAPTGPKNANVPGANYRGGGRGGRRGYHPYARGGM